MGHIAVNTSTLTVLVLFFFISLLLFQCMFLQGRVEELSDEEKWKMVNQYRLFNRGGGTKKIELTSKESVDDFIKLSLQSTCTQMTLRIFIFLGQSQMSGYGLYKDEFPSSMTTSSPLRVEEDGWYINSSPNDQNGPEVSCTSHLHSYYLQRELED
jgi:hypothetical protein